LSKSAIILIVNVLQKMAANCTKCNNGHLRVLKLECARAGIFCVEKPKNAAQIGAEQYRTIEILTIEMQPILNFFAVHVAS
jgi:hypothetical protein